MEAKDIAKGIIIGVVRIVGAAIAVGVGVAAGLAFIFWLASRAP